MNLRNTSRLAVLLLATLLSMQAAILSLTNYVDPNPAPGQASLNGYVKATLGNAGGLNGSYLVVCVDYDFFTSVPISLEGIIVAPTSEDQVVQATIFLAYAGFMADPLNSAVDTMSYAIWRAKSGTNVPNVLGSSGVEAGYRLLVQGNFAFYQAQAAQGAAMFVPNGHDGKNPNQAFIFAAANRSEVPEPGTIGLLGAGLVALGACKLRGRRKDPEEEGDPEDGEDSATSL